MSQEKIPVPAMTFAELKNLVKKTKDEIDALSDNLSVSETAITVTYNDFFYQKKNLIEGLLKKLMEQKDRFAHVFATEIGSTYFVTKDGQSLRFRVDRETGEIDIQQIMKNIFFTDESGFEIIKNARKLAFFSIIDHAITTTAPKIGSYPLELNSVSLYGEIVFETTPTTLTIKGSKYPNEKIQDQIFGGLHIGHQITKIF
ncbi:MAG: hypothetical protein WCT18_03230 [Patescibacteria group bacterium]